MNWLVWLLIFELGCIAIASWATTREDNSEFVLGWLAEITFIFTWVYIGYEVIRFP